MTWNERQAHLALTQSAAQTKQHVLKSVNHQTIKKEAARERVVNDAFWHSVWVSCNVLLLLIVIYAAFSFGASL